MLHKLLICLFMWSLIGVLGYEVKSVMEGDSVTLYTKTSIHSDYMIQWFFESLFTRIATIDKAVNKIPTYDDGRFKGRLQLNVQTGDLTITNMRTEDSGEYSVIISDMVMTLYRFNVYAHLPVPVITRDSCSCSKCVLLCSVINVTDVTDVSLSWYKRNSLLSNISLSDLNISSISLHLEVEYQDTNTYSCAVNNPLINQTQHLNITHLCQPCSDCVGCCGSTEAVIRLVFSALVGVAAVAVLIYD
ncbi:SLAM family member 5-like isoform X2 [Misgurnus anguillicaudatus]|uniref:SLAM family member 5-like isoform X2 n=1 Tax=Misgurnus anguillicaudatus TaxID=75329 RepID=UPI003CCF5D80